MAFVFNDTRCVPTNIYCMRGWIEGWLNCVKGHKLALYIRFDIHVIARWFGKQYTLPSFGVRCVNHVPERVYMWFDGGKERRRNFWILNYILIRHFTKFVWTNVKFPLKFLVPPSFLLKISIPKVIHGNFVSITNLDFNGNSRYYRTTVNQQ